MNIYMVESWVSGPLILEACSEENAKDVYATNKGYADWYTMRSHLGLADILINIERIEDDVYKYNESRRVKIGTC